jgi:RNA polymerase sigma-70 factor (ECF subfamily)
VRIHGGASSGGDHGDWAGNEGKGLDVPDPNRSATPAALAERSEVKEAIERAILDLDEPARKLVVLRDLAGESYHAISSALGLPLGTVKSRIHRARLELQSRLAPWVSPA